MDKPERPGGANGGDDEAPEFSIARSSAFVPLLIMFGLTVLAILVAVVRTKPLLPPTGEVANKAFGPADFPGVFGTDQALAGLEGGSEAGAKMTFPVPAPPFSEGIFPCMECHEGLPPNAERRPLEAMHDDIALHHDEEHRWCLDCHDLNDRDRLHLASGELIPFTESYRLCGQCHGTQYRDWRSGIHGKRTGYWNGSKRYLLCIHCHNPHNPHFAALQPLPPPVRPQFLRPEYEAGETAADEQRATHREGG